MKPPSSVLRILDTASPAPGGEGTPLYWNTWEAPGGISALALQAERQEQTRTEFLQWVHDAGNMRINGRSIREHFRLPDGFSAWFLSRIFERHPAVFGPGLYEIFKLRALEEWADREGFQHIELHSSAPALRRTVQAWCRNSQRTCVLSPPDLPQKSFTILRKNAFLRACRSAYDALRELRRWLREERPLFARSPALAPAKGIAATVWLPNYDEQAAREGRFRSKYWTDLHTLLDASATPVHWLFIPAGGDLAAQKTMRDRCAQNTPHTMTFWQECVASSDCLPVLRGFTASVIAALRLAPHLKTLCQWAGSRMEFSEYVRPVWEDSFCGPHLMRQLLFQRGIENWSSRIGPQEVVLAPSEMQVWERVLYRHARKMGKPRIMAAMHSMVGAGDFRFFTAPADWDDPEFIEQMPDIFLCNGSAALSFMRQGGFPEERLQAAEALRYPYLNGGPQEHQPAVPGTLVAALTYYADEVEAQVRILAQALEKGLPPHIRRVVIKPHPMYSPEAHLARHFPNNDAPETVHTPMPELLRPGIVIYAGNSTTVAVEAAYRGIPVIVQEAVNSFSLSPLSGIPDACFVRTAEELLQALAKPATLRLPEDFFFLDKELPRWKQLLNNFLRPPL